MKNGGDKKFSDGRNLCLIAFVVFGNYFAVFGISHADKAASAMFRNDRISAEYHARRAKVWALWGLIPSTLINIALIWGFCILFWKIARPMFKQLGL